MNILFADSQGVVRYGTIALVKELIPNAQVFEANNHVQVCSQLRNEKISILLLNTEMCGDHSISSISKFKKICPDIRILLLSTYTEKVFASHLMEAGAEGFINAKCTLDQMKSTISEFLNRIKQTNATDCTANSITSSPNHAENNWLSKKFSERELTVLTFLRSGIPLIEIAKLLAIKPSTVSTYKCRIFTKLGVENYRELTDLLSMAS